MSADEAAPRERRARFRWPAPKSFRTKFIMVVGAAVIFDLLLSGSVALWNVVRLGRDASGEIRHGLEAANTEYLTNYLETTALRANLLLSQVQSDVSALAASMQDLEDQAETQQMVGDALSGSPVFTPPLIYHPEGRWAQNERGTPSVLSVWGYLLDAQHQPKPEVQRLIRRTAAFDLFASSLMRYGARKLQLYYMGPKALPIMRTTPYSDQAQTFDKLYPGHNEQNFWDFFFPGVYEVWQGWLKNPKSVPEGGYITRTMPYVDAITGKLIVTYFHPLWNADRTDCAGAVAADITLEQLAELSAGVHLARTGFAFLAQSNGNVLAISPEGEKTLGIEMKNESGTPGVTGLSRTLGNSIYPEIASLAMPHDGGVSMRTITMKKHGQPEPYIVALRKLNGGITWADGKVAFDYPTLGFVVSEREIYESLRAAQSEVSEATDRILEWQVGVVCLSLGVVLLAVFGISRRITAGISALATAAKQIEQKDYSVRVQVPSKDEVGELARAFNEMTSEIESHTAQLEQKVEERTQRLSIAHREIIALNDRLKGENLRLGAELDVARRIQTMVLPKPNELEALPPLDISAYMEPATEVGGDYYDVLEYEGHVKIGIGDVTGHGVESGVLMLMVQAATRALVENGEINPKRFLSVLNQVLIKNLVRADSENNLTLSFLDYSENTITLTGQHEEVILVRASGEVERIDTMDLGFPVGLESDIDDFLASRSLRFAQGDTVVLYTDGVTEAENPAGEFFKIERLCESAARWSGGTATEIRQGILGDVMRHLANAPLLDDITLVVIKHN
jgi:sigma-B regulation protein RsbU (phosphoserine phosphatase)